MAATGLRQQLVEPPYRVVLQVREPVGVDVEGEGYVRVPKHFRHHLDVHAVRKHEGGEGVPEAVEGDGAPKPGTLEQGAKDRRSSVQRRMGRPKGPAKTSPWSSQRLPSLSRSPFCTALWRPSASRAMPVSFMLRLLQV